MAQLNNFSAGLNTRLAPHLINIAESTICDNVDITKATIYPLANDEDMNTSVGSNIIFFKNGWVSTSSLVNYQIMQEKLYYSGVGIPQKSSDGVTWYNLGITPPSKPFIMNRAPGVLEGRYAYCYTYYNSNDGTESAPSPYTPDFDLVNEKVSLTHTASTDPQVTNIRFYRIGGALTVMSLVATIGNTTVAIGDVANYFVDNIADVDIPGDILSSQLAGQAPAGLKYLTKHNVMLFGSVNDKLYFSEVAFPNNWSPYHFIDFDETITGLGSTQNGLLVFTEYSTYIITGTAPENLSNFMLSNNQGCIKHNSIQFSNNTLLWLSHDGICASSGTEIQVISRPKLGKISLLNPRDAVVWDDIYFLAHDGGILCVDFRFGAVFYTMDTFNPILIDSFCVANNYLHYSSGGKLYRMFEGKVKRKYTYKTGNLSDGSISNLKNYKVVYIHSDEEVTVDVIFSDKVTNSYNMIDGLNELKLPQITMLNYYIAFMFRGIGEVREVEYKVIGRQNGR